MPRRYSYDYDYEDRYWEWREEQEEEERYLAWTSEVDEHCECVWTSDEEAEMLKYCRVPWKAPVQMCAFHVHIGEEDAAAEVERAAAGVAAAAAWAAERAAEEARVAEEMRRAEEAAEALRVARLQAEAAPLNIRVAAAEILARAKLGQHRFKQPIAFVQARLTIIEKGGLTQDERIGLIRDIFAYLAQPESRGLLADHARFRSVVQAKINEFRDEPRAAEIVGIMNQLEDIIMELEAPVPMAVNNVLASMEAQ